MQKRGRNSCVKGIAISEISVIIIAIFAFAFVLSEASLVVGAEGDLSLGLGASDYRSSPSSTPAAANPTTPQTKDTKNLNEAGTPYSGQVSSILGLTGEVGSATAIAGSLVDGVAFAAVAYGMGQMIGSIAGFD